VDREEFDRKQGYTDGKKGRKPIRYYGAYLEGYMEGRKHYTPPEPGPFGPCVLGGDCMSPRCKEIGCCIQRPGGPP